MILAMVPQQMPMRPEMRLVPLRALDANGLMTFDTALDNEYNNSGNWSPDGTLYDPPSSTECYEGTPY
eukprot:CAMPEP_0184295442 /NCGR_PEP_ID=MMETSP1049-20130417/6279_1 /TAXON_ID=77928 /ORGANISM="Proteomonas sulcata, Strain CCMP704" /LENGTH=67 /DNA_ID=CAMNT_0026603941 /DNA_START=101 /DNA_END=304 /DNA_ORIENTATION=+